MDKHSTQATLLIGTAYMLFKPVEFGCNLESKITELSTAKGHHHRKASVAFKSAKCMFVSNHSKRCMPLDGSMASISIAINVKIKTN